MQPGRYALMRGDSKVALAHFQRAADLDPDSTHRHGGLIKEGVWTYVGRAYYQAGDFPAARKALEQARSRHPDDYLAPLYLGLVLSRAGDQPSGSKEIQTGLTGLGDWLDWIEYKASMVFTGIQGGLSDLKWKKIWSRCGPKKLTGPTSLRVSNMWGWRLNGKRTRWCARSGKTEEIPRKVTTRAHS